MYEEEAHPKVLTIIERNTRVANVVKKEPRLLQLLNIAASQNVRRVTGNRWEAYESLKKTYREVVKSSGAKNELSTEDYEVLMTVMDELLPVLTAREILQLEFAEPLHDEYGEEL